MINKFKFFICITRMYIIKICAYSSKIEFSGFFNINTGTSIEVGKKTVFSIGKGVLTRKGAVLSVRDNAVLTIGNNVFVNRNSIIISRKSIVIEDGVTIGSNVYTIMITTYAIGGGVCA